MFFKSFFSVGQWRFNRWLLIAFVAGSAGCNSSDNDTVATSPTPSGSPIAATPPLNTQPLLSLSSDRGFDGVAAGANVTITTTLKGLVIQALTTDPSIVLPRLTAPHGKGLSVHIRFVSPGATTLQVFYDTKKNGGSWDETRSIRKPTAQGENDITVTITDADFGGGIRIDPGDLKGEYTISLIELRP
jgi:hypothetical protein